jgi:UDPglucose--hexose-1-phosphate uridylyltransferase
MKELLHQRAYFEDNGRTMLSDYLANELSQKERIVLENNSFVVVVPFWAVWPFETMIISKRKVGSIAGFSDAELKDLADIIKRLTIKYDNLFEVSFPYSSGMHQAPTDGKEYPCWHWHFHFYPPLLRSATVKKFMVGYEMLANPQRDITPEASAARLRELSEIHYKQKK